MKNLNFSGLLPSDDKLDKVYTFISLLHLKNQKKIDLLQKEHFGEIDIVLRAKRVKSVNTNIDMSFAE